MKRAVLLAVAACSEPTTAVDLELLPNPELNSVDELVGRVRTMVVVVDAASGRLYPPEAERLDGDVQIKNADSDPNDLELVARVDVPEGRLPSIRIERGGLPDVPLHVRVLGSVDGEPGTEMARGGVTGVTFTDGQVTTVPTPFNLLPRYLPLMVTEVVPSDGSVVKCNSPFSILAVFSRAVDAATVTPNNHFNVTEPGMAKVPLVDPTVSQNTATFTFGRQVYDYRVTISSGVTDTSGAQLDQLPGMDGLQSYEADFHVECDMTMTPAVMRCSPADPTGPCPGGARFRCEKGTCVPATCDGAACQPGYTCDPLTFQCELDCAVYGDCP